MNECVGGWVTWLINRLDRPDRATIFVSLLLHYLFSLSLFFFVCFFSSFFLRLPLPCLALPFLAGLAHGYARSTSSTSTSGMRVSSRDV
jgi:hypothetical protein